MRTPSKTLFRFSSLLGPVSPSSLPSFNEDSERMNSLTETEILDQLNDFDDLHLSDSGE